MKKVPFVVLSACVLALGLRVYADQTPTPKPTQTPSTKAPVAAPAMATSHAAASTSDAETAMVKQYCASCHNDRNKNNAGGLSLASFDASKVGHDAQVAETAEKMIRKLRAGM